MFCPAKVNGCVGIDQDTYDTCKNMETIGTSLSTIQVGGGGYFTDENGGEQQQTTLGKQRGDDTTATI
jgi:hypothetical protein